MADRTVTLKRYDSSLWENVYPKTTIAQVINLSTQLANMQSDINGKQATLTNPVEGSSYPGAYSPSAGDFLYYGGFGWQTSSLAELHSMMGFQYVSGLLATITANTTTAISGLSNYKWLLIEIVAAGVRETKLIRYVSGQSVQISAYIAGSWRYITLTTYAASIVSTLVSGSPTIYVYGVK